MHARLNKLNPRRIPNNFRSQILIDEEFDLLKAVLANREGMKSADMIDVALMQMEVSNCDEAIEFSNLAIATARQENTSQAENNETIATAHYVLGVAQREKNKVDMALEQLNMAYNLAQSDWLKSNILRAIGLTYLKKQVFLSSDNKSAYAFFKQAYELVCKSDDRELEGSKPALLNYIALSLTRGKLASKQDPDEGVKLFEETTALYKSLFKARSISEEILIRCHDWQSHQFHRGMILCEMAENGMGDFTMPGIALDFLSSALSGRKTNKADDQRLGDIYVWLGRVAVTLQRHNKAVEYFSKALDHYRITFKDIPDAKQILDTQDRLNTASKLQVGTVLTAREDSAVAMTATASTSTTSLWVINSEKVKTNPDESTARPTGISMQKR